MLGSPVIATACGGPLEIIAPAFPDAKATGWLVSPTDSNALAQAVCTLLQERNQTTLITQRGQERAKTEFTAQRMAAQTVQLYQAIRSQA